MTSDFPPPVVTGSAPRPLHPRVRWLWWIGSVGSDLAVLAVGVVITIVVSVNTDWTPPTWWWVLPLGLAVVSLVGRSWYVGAAYRAWRYRFGADGLDLTSGVFWRHTSSVPYHRLQQVDVGQGPLERWLGMATVSLRTAAATTDATIPGIEVSDVDELRRRLLERAGRDDGA